jgi:hypothetical protein
MSIAFDESGRPFIIIREQDKKKRVKGLEAHKVRFISTAKIRSAHTIVVKHPSSKDGGKPNEDISRPQRYG